MQSYIVYLLASAKYGIYVGGTNDIIRRVTEHREGRGGDFTNRYGVMNLVWFETHTSIAAAIQREKSLKRWPRVWKINLIELENPQWQDLFPVLLADWFPALKNQ